jgi:hypothetical protein
MSEVQDLDRFAVLIQPVIDMEWGMEQASDAGMPLHGSAEVRKGLQQFNVIEEIIGKFAGCVGMPIP